MPDFLEHRENNGADEGDDGKHGGDLWDGNTGSGMWGHWAVPPCQAASGGLGGKLSDGCGGGDVLGGLLCHVPRDASGTDGALDSRGSLIPMSSSSLLEQRLDESTGIEVLHVACLLAGPDQLDGDA